MLEQVSEVEVGTDQKQQIKFVWPNVVHVVSVVTCPAPSCTREKGSRQTCRAPMSPRNAIIEFLTGINTEAHCIEIINILVMPLALQQGKNK